MGFVEENSFQGWWERKFQSSDIELAIHCCFVDEAQQDATLAEMRQSAAKSGLQELLLPSFPQETLSGVRPHNGMLHFGYRDGITQPEIDWEDKKIPGGVERWQFVMGYYSDDYPVDAKEPGPWLDFAKDGCFAGLTWLYQDVVRFNKFLLDNAPKVTAAGVLGDAQEWLAAKLMGRWRNGSPLAIYPTTQPTTLDRSNANAFGYSDDPGGEKCPLTAHIRVVNSRDQGLDSTNRERFPDGQPKTLDRTDTGAANIMA
jgi:deferrochelatase/peroxidase EfeB